MQQGVQKEKSMTYERNEDPDAHCLLFKTRALKENSFVEAQKQFENFLNDNIWLAKAVKECGKFFYKYPSPGRFIFYIDQITLFKTLWALYGILAFFIFLCKILPFLRYTISRQ